MTTTFPIIRHGGKMLWYNTNTKDWIEVDAENIPIQIEGLILSKSYRS